MSSHKSEHLDLHLWEPGDDFLRTEFNKNFAAVDAGMKAEEDARISAVTAETEARTAAVEEERAARSAAIQAVQTALSATGGNASAAVSQLRADLTAQIQTAQSAADRAYSPENKPYAVGSYTGTGTYGSGGATTLTLGFPPSALIVSAINGTSILAIRPQIRVSTLGIQWLADGVSWSSGDSADHQLNASSKTYYYVAFR